MTAPHGWTDPSVDADARPSYRHRLRDTAQALALRHVQRRLARTYTDGAFRSVPPTSGVAQGAEESGSQPSVRVCAPHFDRDRVGLLGLLREAMRGAGIVWTEERRPWSERPLWHVDADPWTVWQALRRASRAESVKATGSREPAESRSLEIRPRQRAAVTRAGRGTTANQRPWPRWLARLLTPEFIETHLADPRLGPVVTLSDTCPAGDEWLISRAPRHDDPLSARLATEAGIDLSFRSRARVRAVLEFPIDVVYTWVDASDPQWQVERDAYPPGPDVVAAATADARFVQGGELRYSS